MQRGSGGRGGPFGFGDPFSGFGGFIPPGNPMPSFLGGSSPFNDPFFTNPFGSMVGPSLFEQSMFGSSMFGPHRGPIGGVMNARGFQHQVPEPSRPKGPIIKELSSDDEDDVDANENVEKKKANPRKHPRISREPYVEEHDGVQDDEDDAAANENVEKKANPRKHPRISREPYVEEPDEVQDNKRPKHKQFGREYARVGTSYQQPQTYMFQSSTVTYGGSNGACYMSSTTRRSGGDGVTMEESKEADTTTGKATHRIAHGIGNKGHALTRKLDCDGIVNTMQTLHNLNEDELAGFEKSWQRNAGQCLPGWDPRVNMLRRAGTFHPGIREGNEMPALPAPSEMFALPAPEQYRGSNSSRIRMRPPNHWSHGHSRP